MMSEIDDGTWKLVRSYCGSDPRIPKTISVEMLHEYSGSWTWAEFRDLIDDAIAKIPSEYRASTRVELDACDHEGYGGALIISYERLQTAEEVAEVVERALRYVLDHYERLKRNSVEG